MANERKLAIVESFIMRLGDPAKYHFTGEVIDLRAPMGSCVCGHAIQYEYMISDGKQKVAVGSECINHFAEYNVGLYNQLVKAREDFIAKRKEEEKAAKAVQEAVELAPYVNAHRKMKESLKELFPNRLPYLPYDLYSNLQYVQKVPTYKRTKSYIKWYKEANKVFSETLKALAPYAEKQREYTENRETKFNSEPATEKQIAFLKKLVKRYGENLPEEWFANLSKSKASQEISIRV